MKKLIRAALSYYLPQYLGELEIENQEQHDQALDELVVVLDKLLDSYKIGITDYAKLVAKFVTK